MESLPPMAARRSPCWAWKAPNKAAKGSPQRAGSSASLGKYSWKVRRVSRRRAPVATSLQTDSATAWTLPWKGEALLRWGSKAQDMWVQASVSPSRTGTLATMASGGVSWFFPPKGERTVPEPMEESNISPRPFWEAWAREERWFEEGGFEVLIGLWGRSQTSAPSDGTDVDFGGALHAVGVDEGAGEIDDLLAAPAHGHAAGVGDEGDLDAFEVFFVGLGDEVGDIGGVDDDGHALLGLGDGELGAVEALVFLRDGIEIDVEAVGEFADRDGDAAGAEVVAAFDFVGEFGIAEEALHLALGGGIAFLNFGGILEGGFGVFFGGAGGPADAVASGAAADEENDVAGGGVAALHLAARAGGDDGSDFHAFGEVAGMVDFGDLAGGEADLVAVRGVSAGGFEADFALGEFVGKGLGEGGARVPSAGDAHRLIDVGTAGEGVADAAAETGGGAAEGFDFGGVVVGLVFELDEVFFDSFGWGRGWVIGVGCGLRSHAPNGDLDDDGGGVDFLGEFEVVEFARFFEFLGGDDGEVHHGLGARGVFAVERFAGLLVAAVGGLNGFGVFAEGDLFDFGEEGGVTAVVGPVGVEEFDLGERRVAFFFVAEVGLGVGEVGKGHGEAELGAEGAQFGLGLGDEAGEGGNVGGVFDGWGESVGKFEGGFVGVDGVDEVVFDCVDLFGAKIAFEKIDLGGSEGGRFLAGENGDALGGGVGALIELAGEKLDGEGVSGGGELGEGLLGEGLGEDEGAGLGKVFVAEAIDKVALEKAQVAELGEVESLAEVGEESLGGLIVFRAFFNVERVHPTGFRGFRGWWLARNVFRRQRMDRCCLRLGEITVS